MEKFNGKIFNPTVFEKYLKTIPSTKELGLIKNAIFTNVSKYKSQVTNQTGGYYIVDPIKGRLDGTPVNYDGVTDSPSGTARKTFYQGKIIFGRQQTWGEDDFTVDITGTNFMAEAGEVNEYWDEQKQSIVLSMLKGIFNMTSNSSTNSDFANKHTYTASGNLSADDNNKASQKALGDKKSKLNVEFMHSAVSTNLESLNLINFLKYTDSQGIERDLTIGTYNGKLVVVDDDMPVESGYYAAVSTDAGALHVVASGASTGEVNLATVKAATFYPSAVAAGDYVVLDNRYTTYMMSKGFFEFENIGTEYENEPDRDKKDNGGHNDLITRRRWAIVPTLISFTKASVSSLSPTNTEFENGANWALVNDDQSTKTYINDKLVPLVRIYSRG